jgi:hypothetical protein
MQNCISQDFWRVAGIAGCEVRFLRGPRTGLCNDGVGIRQRLAERGFMSVQSRVNRILLTRSAVEFLSETPLSAIRSLCGCPGVGGLAPCDVPQ